jgi:hypothetical protein
MASDDHRDPSLELVQLSDAPADDHEVAYAKAMQLAAQRRTLELSFDELVLKVVEPRLEPCELYFFRERT